MGICAFYAVTLGHPTPYLFTLRHSQHDLRKIPVIYPRGEIGAIPGEKLPSGNLVIFYPDGIKLAEGISRIPGKTMIIFNEEVLTRPVVGLFLDHQKAKDCFKCKKEPERLDPRWQEETTEVLGLIGNSHEIFIIPNSLEWVFSKEDLQSPVK